MCHYMLQRRANVVVFSVAIAGAAAAVILVKYLIRLRKICNKKKLKRVNTILSS